MAARLHANIAKSGTPFRGSRRPSLGTLRTLHLAWTDLPSFTAQHGPHASFSVATHTPCLVKVQRLPLEYVHIGLTHNF